MPKASSKRKRDNPADPATTTTPTDQEADIPMAPAQDTKKQGGNDLEGRDFYEVLGIKRDATPKEISIAYRKLATKIHPDKNREDPFANDKFQTLGKIHMTLSDPEKRKIYDQTGETSDDVATMGEADWAAYFALIFKKISKKDISDFSSKYRGSDEERKDILEAYTKQKGNLKKVLDHVMTSREEDLERFATYCKQAIDAGQVQAFPGFKKFEKYVGSTEIVGDEAEEEAIPTDLIAGFAQRRQAFDDLTARLEAKYGGAGGEAEGGKKKKKVTTTRAKRGVPMRKTRVGVQKKKVEAVEEEEVSSEEGEEMEA